MVNIQDIVSKYVTYFIKGCVIMSCFYIVSSFFMTDFDVIISLVLLYFIILPAVMALCEEVVKITRNN